MESQWDDINMQVHSHMSASMELGMRLQRTSKQHWIMVKLHHKFSCRSCLRWLLIQIIIINEEEKAVGISKQNIVDWRRQHDIPDNDGFENGADSFNGSF